MLFLPFAAKQAIEQASFPRSFMPDCLHQFPFAEHAAMLHDAFRAPVFGQAARLNPPDISRCKCIFDQGLRRFSGITFSPHLRPQKIAEIDNTAAGRFLQDGIADFSHVCTALPLYHLQEIKFPWLLLHRSDRREQIFPRFFQAAGAHLRQITHCRFIGKQSVMLCQIFQYMIPQNQAGCLNPQKARLRTHTSRSPSRISVNSSTVCAMACAPAASSSPGSP